MYSTYDDILLQLLQIATTCTSQVVNSFLSNVDSWISNASQFVTRKLLQDLKDHLRGIYNIFIIYVCT